MTLIPTDESGNSPSWQAIFDRYEIANHDFDTAPYPISAGQIKLACQHFTKTSEKEVRILCKQDTRESRPQVFRDRGLFILPVANGSYVIVKGEGYIDILNITSPSAGLPECFSVQVGDFGGRQLGNAVPGSSLCPELDPAFCRR